MNQRVLQKYMFEKFTYYISKLQQKARRKLSVLNTVELSQSALEHNYKLFQKMHPEAAVCPVLKSNAYGHGLKYIARMLDPLKPAFFIVDSYYEAFELQKQNIHTPCLVIGYTHPKNYKNMRFKNISLSIMDEDAVDALGKSGKKATVHVEVDTGMHRQGVLLEKFADMLKKIKKYPNIKVEGIWTHLADADNTEDRTFTDIQVKRFKKAIKIGEDMGFSFKWKHISASGGAGKIFDEEFNLIRLGISLYGASALDKKDPDYKKHGFDELKPVMRLTSSIVDIKPLNKGECVSYNCTFHAPHNMMIGIIPAGYHEGINRHLSNEGYVYYKGKPCKIVGRVCMNLTAIDISEIKDAKRLDEVEIIGNKTEQKNSAMWMAEKAGTISYVILSDVAPTIRRKIVK